MASATHVWQSPGRPMIPTPPPGGGGGGSGMQVRDAGCRMQDEQQQDAGGGGTAAIGMVPLTTSHERKLPRRGGGGGGKRDAVTNRKEGANYPGSHNNKITHLPPEGGPLANSVGQEPPIAAGVTASNFVVRKYCGEASKQVVPIHVIEVHMSFTSKTKKI